MTLNFNMAETLAIAIGLLLLGKFIKENISFLRKYFIPVPVIGGVIFSIVILIGHNTNAFLFKFDMSLKSFLMIAFFTTIGFLASFKQLKSGGVGVAIFLGAATILVILQDIIGVSLAKVFGLHPFIGLAAGSVPLTGGHGTSGAFGPLLEQAGATGAMTVAIACATFGLVAGCMIGGPIGKKLLEKHGLKGPTSNEDFIATEEQKNDKEIENHKVTENSIFDSVIFIGLAMGLGAWIPIYAKKLGITLPSYIGPMLVAAIIRNVLDGMKKKVPLEEISIVGNISLSLFLAMALMSMKLWQLADLAIPLIVILVVQTCVMGLFAYFVTFNMMGRDYDAATMACGHCGFGMGATPNAMANMESFTSANGHSIKAFFVIPLVGGLFIDFTNALIITFFMNMFG